MKSTRKQQEEIEKLFALCFVLSSRTAELEASNAELRAALHLDPPPPAIGADWMTIAQAAHATGYTESGIRKRIELGKIVAKKIGRRVLIDATSIKSAKELVERTFRRA